MYSNGTGAWRRPSRTDCFLSALLVVTGMTGIGFGGNGRPSGDGYLRQKLGILVYGQPGDRIARGRDWILKREIGSFETFLWRESGRRLFVDPIVLYPGRRLKEREYIDTRSRWGYLPDFSQDVASDLKRAGFDRHDFDAIVILYEPLDNRETSLAGATYLPPDISSIPLRDETYLEGGRKHPLHRLLVHEYLHQMEFAFERIEGNRYLIDPDTEDWEQCSAEAVDELQVELKQNATCSEIEWSLLSPEAGTWVRR